MTHHVDEIFRNVTLRQTCDKLSEVNEWMNKWTFWELKIDYDFDFGWDSDSNTV